MSIKYFYSRSSTCSALEISSVVQHVRMTRRGSRLLSHITRFHAKNSTSAVFAINAQLITGLEYDRKEYRGWGRTYGGREEESLR